jgi:hypothetical protein
VTADVGIAAHINANIRVCIQPLDIGAQCSVVHRALAVVKREKNVLRALVELLLLWTKDNRIRREDDHLRILRGCLTEQIACCQ